MKGNLSRRQFLKFLTAVGAAAGLAASKLLQQLFQTGSAQGTGGTNYLPLVSRRGNPTPTRGDVPDPTDPATPTTPPSATPQPTQPTPGTPLPPVTGSRVVCVHNPRVTDWNGSSQYYWNYVEQDAVDEMVDRGMMALTGTASVAEAWKKILPHYKVGEGIAVKVNINNTACNQTKDGINAIAEPVNAVIRGLKLIGVAERDIWVYDATRFFPKYLLDGIGGRYPGVQFFANECQKPVQKAGFTSTDQTSFVNFPRNPGDPVPPQEKVTDVVVQAMYLINMPILKFHTGWIGASLSFKNHFGTIHDPDSLHRYTELNQQDYRSNYSTFVDIYRNPNVGPKTVLTIGDGIFGAKDKYSAPPTRWTSLGNQFPRRLFFATDPVALDCVMMDFVGRETMLPAGADDYLKVARDAGLGTYERGNPQQGTDGYKQIDYRPFDL